MRNNHFTMGNVTFIELLHKGETYWTQIALEDLEKLLRTDVRWYIMNVGGKYEKLYIGAKIGGKTVYLHQFITEAPKGMVVDHINHNTLDNHRENLRVITNAQNQQNRKGASRNNKSTGLRNVSKLNGKYRVLIRIDGVLRNFGTYETKEEANQVAIAKRKQFFPYATV